MEDEDEAVKIALAKSVLFTIQEEEDCRIVQTISILFNLISCIFIFIVFIIFFIFIICLFLLFSLFLLYFLFLLFIIFVIFWQLAVLNSQLAARRLQLAVFSSLTPHIQLQPTYKPTLCTNVYKKIKNIYTQIRWVKNIETLNLKSATEDTSLMSRGKRFHSPTILFMKLNLNKLVLEWLVKRFGVSLLLNAYPLSTS